MLAYERHGSGEPLVLVHGVAHRRQAWYPVLDAITPYRDVILVDLPGHGDSPDLVTDGRPVPDVLRDVFKTFLDDVGLVRPHVAGNSLGGLIALYAGANGHARSVTALSPAGFWRNAAEFGYTKRIFLGASNAIDRIGPRVEMLARTVSGRKVMYGLLTAHPARVSPEQAAGDIHNFVRARPALLTLLDAAEPFDLDIPIETPVTISWAARDLVLPPWQAEQAKRRLPLADHLTMRGVGHVPMTDNPRFVAEVLLRGSAPAATITRFDRPKVKGAPRRAATA